MITTTDVVREVCVVEGNIVKERAKAEEKCKRHKRQAAANRAKKKSYLPPPFSLGKLHKRNFLNLVTMQSFSCQMLRLYVICEVIR